ncbi:hypothetical protein BST61_g1848 [Cercospora zeina]
MPPRYRYDEELSQAESSIESLTASKYLHEQRIEYRRSRRDRERRGEHDRDQELVRLLQEKAVIEDLLERARERADRAVRDMSAEEDMRHRLGRRVSFDTIRTTIFDFDDTIFTTSDGPDTRDPSYYGYLRRMSDDRYPSYGGPTLPHYEERRPESLRLALIARVTGNTFDLMTCPFCLATRVAKNLAPTLIIGANKSRDLNLLVTHVRDSLDLVLIAPKKSFDLTLVDTIKKCLDLTLGRTMKQKLDLNLRATTHGKRLDQGRIPRVTGNTLDLTIFLHLILETTRVVKNLARTPNRDLSTLTRHVKKSLDRTRNVKSPDLNLIARAKPTTAHRLLHLKTKLLEAPDVTKPHPRPIVPPNPPRLPNPTPKPPRNTLPPSTS